MGGGASLPQCAPETAWLMAMVDCERREKQWLAERYDAKCAEAKVLEQQLASLQLQLAVAPEPLAPVSETHAQEGGALSPASSCSPLSPSLKERRGLKLTLDTASANHRIPVHAPAPSAPSAPVIAVIEANKAEALGADNKKEAPARRQPWPQPGAALVAFGICVAAELRAGPAFTPGKGAATPPQRGGLCQQSGLSAWPAASPG
ncbi:unnamed protein product [Effrenium voratum]|nr:unnamed protein product [Effrenium voratum]CAJ1416685.1 unnamed protein product [Effrenium voratum]